MSCDKRNRNPVVLDKSSEKTLLGSSLKPIGFISKCFEFLGIHLPDKSLMLYRFYFRFNGNNGLESLGECTAVGLPDICGNLKASLLCADTAVYEA